MYVCTVKLLKPTIKCLFNLLLGQTGKQKASCEISSAHTTALLGHYPSSVPEKASNINGSKDPTLWLLIVQYNDTIKTISA